MDLIGNCWPSSSFRNERANIVKQFFDVSMNKKPGAYSVLPSKGCHWQSTHIQRSALHGGHLPLVSVGRIKLSDNIKSILNISLVLGVVSNNDNKSRTICIEIENRYVLFSIVDRIVFNSQSYCFQQWWTCYIFNLKFILINVNLFTYLNLKFVLL